MRRIQIATAAILVFLASSARVEAAPAGSVDVLGTVTNAARPVADALVIALNLQDLASSQTWTGADGSFAIQSLRSGVYRIIAVKQGFVPAVTTFVPTQPVQRVALKLRNQSRTAASKSQDIWELRAMLPPDILREVEGVLAMQNSTTFDAEPRFRGEMMSVAGMAAPSAPTYAQTALDVEGRIGDGWRVGVRGNLQRLQDPADRIGFGSPVAETTGMSMEVEAGEQSSYRVASTSSSWMYVDGVPGAREAGVRAHNFEWQRGPASLQVRYFEQQNLFSDHPLDSNLIEVSGNVPVFSTLRNELAVAVRVMQESVEAHDATFRRADLSANGSIELVPSLLMHYGIATRVGVEGQEFAPRTGAEWKLTEHSSLVGSAMVKVIDRDPASVIMPSVVYFSENGRDLPRYSYTFGFVSGSDPSNRFSAIATLTAIDEPLRLVFADEHNQFWDGLLVDVGDIRRDLRLAYRKEFGDNFAIDVATSAGTAKPAGQLAGERAKVYVSGDLQSTFRPTRTTIAVSYRDVQQPRNGREEDYRAERLNLRMAQSLYLPIDIKLLVGLELARAENSPYLADSYMEEGESKKYIGGLAVNF